MDYIIQNPREEYFPIMRIFNKRISETNSEVTKYIFELEQITKAFFEISKS